MTQPKQDPEKNISAFLSVLGIPNQYGCIWRLSFHYWPKYHSVRRLVPFEGKHDASLVLDNLTSGRPYSNFPYARFLPHPSCSTEEHTSRNSLVAISMDSERHGGRRLGVCIRAPIRCFPCPLHHATALLSSLLPSTRYFSTILSMSNVSCSSLCSLYIQEFNYFESTDFSLANLDILHDV